MNMDDAEYENAKATAGRIMLSVQAAADRRCAIFCLRFMQPAELGDQTNFQPSEADIATVIAAIHKNPKIVPSCDPDDP